MRILRPAFSLLIITGCWNPFSSASKCKRAVYDVYTVVLFLTLHSCTLSQILDLVINVRNADDFADNIYILVTTLSSCSKFTTLLLKRENIRTFVKILKEDLWRPKGDDEIKIRKEFDESAGSSTIRYTILVQMSVACMILSPLIVNNGDKKLISRCWLPFDYSTYGIFALVYTHQALAIITCALLNISCDCIVSGLLVHTSGQIEILIHRLKNITIKTRHEVASCVILHNSIYRYAYEVNAKFKITIGIQLIISTLVVCFILYQFSNAPPTSTKYVGTVLYMASMIIEVFFYCWFGNQLKLKSMEVVYAIFEMDWVTLDCSTKKTLLLIMRRAMDPIECTCAYIIPMNLDTFISILKLSYSTYNLLQGTSRTRS